MARTPHRIVSIGYGGRVLDEFIEQLQGLQVGLLVDVRLNAVSRRKGFAKTALRTGLHEGGIEYRHARALGTPNDVRPFFRALKTQAALERYAPVLDTPEALDELEQIVEDLKTRTVAILCLEEDEAVCHRQAVIGRVLQMAKVPVIRV